MRRRKTRLPWADSVHRLLTRQLDRHLRGAGNVPPDVQTFVSSVDEAYRQSDEDRAMLERSLELSSNELLHANDELRAVVQAFPDVFFRVSADGTILDHKGGDSDDPFSSGGKRLLGRRLEDIPVEPVGRRFADALAQVGREEKLVSVEYALEVAGERRFYEARLVPLRQQHGDVMVIIRNITELREALYALSQQAAELARSNAELEQFAYVASHDLQEPLRTISSYLQLLHRRYQGRLDAEAVEFIEYAVEGAKRMRALIHDLLAYARVSSRGNPPKDTALDEIVDEVLEGLRTVIAERGAEITRHPLPTMRVDRTQIAQLYQNLLSNALKFVQGGAPRVHLSAEKRGPEWVFGVGDNGIGIDARHAERVFEIFKRLHGRGEYEGTGIGLAICKRIVERHGGRIWVESAPGRGSTFYFTLAAGPKDHSR
jgi:signal transduction histidine kinase